MTWLTSAHDSSSEAIFALRPNLAADYAAFESVFREQELLPAELLAALRLRIAEMHRCDAELARSVEGIQRDAIDGSRWQHCVELAELFVIDPQTITDTQVALVREQLGDAGVVALFEVCALYDGYCRFQIMLGAGAGAKAERQT